VGFFVSRVEILGLHGRADIVIDLFPGVNVLYGRNGSGKTTLLHIVANALNGSLDRFAYLDFASISIHLHNGHVLRIRKIRHGSYDLSFLVEVSLDEEVLTTFKAGLVASVDAAESSGYPTLGGFRRLPRSSSFAEAMAEGLTQAKEIDQAAQRLPVERAAYFPAFRTMIEAWRSMESGSADSGNPYIPPPSIFPVQSKASGLTRLARELFGQFVPEIDYQSAIEIEQLLGDQVKSAEYDIATASEEILSDAFVGAFAALAAGNSDPDEQQDETSTNTEEIVERIQQLLRDLGESQIEELPETRQTDVYQKLIGLLPEVQANQQSATAANVLAVYRDSLERQLEIQRSKLEPIKTYVRSVNDFLEGKSLTLTGTESDPYDFQARIGFGDGSTESLKVLSSGERQLVSVLYAASSASMERSSVVLIDEPELSLHIDWQRQLISRMAQQLGDRQLIVCTHSPEVGADFEDKYQEVLAVPTKIQDAARSDVY
jgi:ABC-type lipoprotein export system ATPase subunit